VLGGVEGMAQVDLGVRLNEHQPLERLGPMAYAVTGTIRDRLRREGRLTDGELPPFRTAGGELVQVELVERPPLRTLPAAA
jgi:hypothetical protein